VFGVGKDLTDLQWRAVVRQLLAQGVLAVEGDYGTLLCTPAGDEVLYRGRQIRLRDDPAKVALPKPARAARAATSGAAAAATELSAADAEVFERLRAWRAAAAKEQGVPAYVIFHDATMRQIAAQSPSTLTELSTVNGVGDAKLVKYGQQVLDLLADLNGQPQ